MDETVLLEGLASHVSNKLIKCSHAYISLLGGCLGNVMFLYYYSHINPKYETVADTALGIILKFHRTTKIYSYCNGLAGFGVGLMQLEQDGFVCGALKTDKSDCCIEIPSIAVCIDTVNCAKTMDCVESVDVCIALTTSESVD